MQDVFWEAKTSIDSYFQGGSFAVTVVAGCIRGRKAHAEPGRLLVDDDERLDDDEKPTGEIPGDEEVRLDTGEIEIVDGTGSGKRPLPDDDEDPDGEPIL
jgi:hypothetical protein